MTENPRPDVAKALEAAGWTPEHQLLGVRRHRHSSGAVLILFSRAGGIVHGPGTTTPGATFATNTPDAVVIAACLAASGQLDPVQAREDSNWMRCLEAAGVDNWDGIGFAAEIQREQQ